MSIQAVSWVLEYSKSRLGARCVLISIANHADRTGRNAWPSIETIALESRLSEREAQYAIAELKELGELEVIYGGGRGRPNMYQLPLMGGKVSSNAASFGKVSTAEGSALSTAPVEQENGANSASFTTRNGAMFAPFTAETVQGLPPLSQKGCTGPPERVHTCAPEPSNTEPKEREEKSFCATGVAREHSVEFLTFWEAYPRKIAKQPASRAWIKNLCEGRLGEILASLMAWKKLQQWTDTRYIPYPATWLNEKRFLETPTESKGENHGDGATRKTFDAIRRDASADAIKRTLGAYKQVASRLLGDVPPRTKPD